MAASENGGRLRQLLDRAAAMGPLDLALRLTLLDLLLKPIGDWRLRPFILGLAAAGLLLPGLLRRRSLWLALTLLLALRVGLDWPLPDNHAYLLGYWCLAVTLALVSVDARSCLALNGRLLVGCAFAFACAWKLLLSPDYLDGTFFRVTLLTDPRFDGFAQLFGGLTPEALTGLREFVRQHADGPLQDAVASPLFPRRAHGLATFLTLFTVMLEAAVAITFLWPRGGWLSKWRHAALIGFCVTVYAVATVEGFGWLLVAMGVAQCEPERVRTRLLYLATFFLILFYREVPWADWLVQQNPW